MWGVPGTNYIHKHDSAYVVRMSNGKMLGYGKTLIIALMKRDWCEANGWKPFPKHIKHIVETPQGHYRIQKSYRRNGKFSTDYFGTFKNLEDAEREVRLLKKYDWDIQTLCDLNE